MKSFSIRNVWLITIYWGLLDIPLFIIYTYYTIYLYQIGFPPDAIGLIFAVGSLANIIGYLLGGFNTDLIGRKHSMTIGAAVVSTSIFLLVSVKEFYSVITLYFLFMAGFSISIVGSNSLLGDSLDEKTYKKYYAIALGVSKIPTIIALPIIILSLAKYDLTYILNYSLKILAVLNLTNIAIVPLMKEHKTNNETKKNSSIIDILKGKRALFIPIISLVYIAFPMFWVLLSVFATEDAGLNLVEWGVIALTWFAAYTPIQTIASKYTEKIPGKISSPLAALFFSINAIIITIYPTLNGFLVAIIFEVLSEAILWPTVFKTEMTLTEPEYRGRYLGVLNMVSSIASSTGNYIGGILFSKGNTYPVIASMIIQITAAILLAKLFGE